MNIKFNNDFNNHLTSLKFENAPSAKIKLKNFIFLISVLDKADLSKQCKEKNHKKPCQHSGTLSFEIPMHGSL